MKKIIFIGLALASAGAQADWNFRGTPNSWASTALENISGNNWQTCQTFASDNPRFKIDRLGDWRETYPSADYKVSPDKSYKIIFNSSTHNISAAEVADCSGVIVEESWYFRGTANNWLATPMSSSDKVNFCTEQHFADINPRFKIDHFADWSENYPASDFLVAPNTTYSVCINALTKQVTALAMASEDTLAPVVSTTPAAGSYNSAQTVTLIVTDNQDSAPQLYCTTDGSIPSALSPSCTNQSFTAEDINATGSDLVVKVFAIDAAGNSALTSFAYSIATVIPSQNSVVYYQNSVNHSAPNMHYWNVLPAITQTVWPGAALESLGDGWYKFDFTQPIDSANVIFNGSAGQTADLRFDPATPCYQNGWVSLETCGYQGDGSDKKAPEVSASPKAGAYSDTQTITLTVIDNTDAAPLLYYTTNGNAATVNDPLYAGETITASDDVETGVDLRINLLAIDQAGNESRSVFNYTIGGADPIALGDNIFSANCDSNYNDYSDNLRIYQVMVEAFVDGDSKIGYGTGYGPSQHNGDLQGIINSLDYIKEMGMNAIWLTPIFDSEGASQLDATGYFTRNYFKIDPKWGDFNKAKELVETAHAKGLYVFFDGVFGHHKGNVPPSPNGNTPQGGSNPVTYPASLPYYTEVATYWIKELKIDGWRLDQAYQVPVEAWREIRKAVVETSNSVTYSNSQGQTVHPLGYMVGEIWKGEQEIKDTGYGSENNRGLCSNFDFPGRYSVVQTFAGEEHMAENGKKDLPASNLTGVFSKRDLFPSNVHPNLMLANHDILYLGDLLQRAGIAGPNDNEYWQRHKGAFGFMAAYTGPITLYYGDEIGNEVENFVREGDGGLYDDHASRDDGKIEGINFSANSSQADLREFIKKLMHIRAQEPALSSGSRTHLQVGDANTIYADLKQKGADTILYITNKSNNAQTVTVSTAQLNAAGTLTDLIDGSRVQESGGSYSIPLAPWQVRYLKAN